ncbi:hypothetical protein GF367_00630 [Candidatus Woesearchaeota archaeon]|nr:hypothetical protein [Candidatus Woesearchaeota archaeon]
MDAQQQVMYKQLAAQVAQSVDRLERLVDNVDEAEVVVRRTKARQQEFQKSFAAQVAVEAVQVEGVDALLREALRETGEVMLRFRELVKLDALDVLREKVDRFPFEFFVTKDEFSAMLAEALRLRL